MLPKHRSSLTLIPKCSLHSTTLPDPLRRLQRSTRTFPGFPYMDPASVQGRFERDDNETGISILNANRVIARDTIALTTPIPPHPAAERLGAGSA
jgi:hypothetical protein